MGQLKLRELEFIALGGLIFCVEASAVHACPEVDKMHEQIIRELHENIIQIYGYGSIGPRIGSIILLLNHCDVSQFCISFNHMIIIFLVTKKAGWRVGCYPQNLQSAQIGIVR